MPEFVEGANRIVADIVDRSGNRVGPGPLMTCLDLNFDTLLSQAGRFTARFPANDPRLVYLQLKKHYLDFYIDGEIVFYGLTEAWNHEIANDGQQMLVVSGRDSLAELAETSLGFGYLTDFSTPGDSAPWNILSAYNTILGILLDAPRFWFATAGDAAWTPDPTTSTLVYGSFAGESALAGLMRTAENTGEAFRMTQPSHAAYPVTVNPDVQRRHVIEWIGTSAPDSGVRAVQGAGDAVAAENNPHICFIQRLAERRDASSMITRITPFGSGFGETRLDLEGTTRAAPAGYTLSGGTIVSDAAETYSGTRMARHVNFKDIRPLFNTDADVQYAKDYLFDTALAYLQRNDDVDDVVEYDLDVLHLPRQVKVGQTIRVIYQDGGYDLDRDLVILGIRTTVDSNGARSYRLTVANTNQWRISESSAIVATMEEGELLAAHPQIDANSYWENFREVVTDDRTSPTAEMPFYLSEEIVTVRQVLFRYKVERLVAPSRSYTLGNATSQNATSNTGLTAAVIDGAVATINGTAVTINGTVATINHTVVAVNTTGATSLNGLVVGMGPAVPALTDGNYGGIATATQSPGPTWVDPPNHYHQIGPHVHEHTHAHTLDSHSHTIAAEHAHTSPSHDHSSPSHAHTSPSHAHTSPSHTHGSAQHMHSSPQHTHPLPALVETFAVTRIPALDSYVLADLEYSVNGSAWASLSTGIPVAGGYTEIDITSAIQNPAGLRRPYQPDNLIQVRRGVAAGAGKSAQIRVKLGVRSTIQSVVVS